MFITKNSQKSALVVFASLMVLLLSVIAYAQPVSVDGIDAQTPERKSTSTGGIAVNSQSGNTTQLDVNASKITAHWQGYYGNVSGEITLDDASSNTLFSWTLASVSGEIFAVNTTASVQWSNITCVNLTNTTGGAEMEGASKINASTLNQQYFISDMHEDNFTATFTNGYSGADVTIGTRTITADDQCPLAYLFVNNATQSTDYQELLLFDNMSALVFATILEPDATVGFDGSQWNFEMLVAQQNASAGTYYFYVELS